MNHFKILLSFIMLFLILETQAAYFNWGAGLLYLRLPHYRGADEFKDYYLPTPYLIYKGDKLEAETSFLRLKFFDSRFFTVKLSLYAGLKVDGDESQAREDMPNLNYTLELGPMFQFHALRTQRTSLKFELITRKVYETDFSFMRGIGFSGGGFVSFGYSAPNQVDWSIETYYGHYYGDRDLHDYYYTVSQQYATADRPIFRADGGFAGSTTALIMNYKLGHLFLIPFIRYDNLTGAVFEDSPLVKQKHYVVYGLGTYMLWF